MKKKTDFYLLKRKSLSEGDLFVTDYIKTKQKVIRLEKRLELLQLRIDSLKSKKVINCKINLKSILGSIRKGMSKRFKKETLKSKNPYEILGSSKKILEKLKTFNIKNVIKKEFYDLKF